MGEKRIPLSRPSFGEEEIEELIRVIESKWITTGPKTAAFEEEFAAFTGSQYALATSCCTAALHLCYLCLDLKPGDEVITSPITWVATVNMIIQAGGKPVFADVDYDTLNLDPASVAGLINERTRAIVPVHFAGLPVDLEAFRKIARKHNLVLIEDAAHAVGSEYEDKKIGADSQFACFSFHPIKNITTGEGGMICVQREDWYQKLKQWRYLGVSRDAWRRYSAEDSIPLYDTVLPGFKYIMTDLQAALGLVQLKKLQQFCSKRAEIAGLYFELLENCEEIDLPGRDMSYNTRHAWHLFVVKNRSKSIHRDELARRLKRKGINVGINFLAVPGLTYYRKKYPNAIEQVPTAAKASERLFSLPLFPDLNEKDVRYTVNTLKELLK